MNWQVRCIAIGLSVIFAYLTVCLSVSIAADLCNVRPLITTLIGADGPLDHCNKGDVVHFQIDASKVSPASVAARYCDFGKQIFIDSAPKSSTVHVVCRYEWKGAKAATVTKNPDMK